MATIRRPSKGSIREVRLLAATPGATPGRAVRWRGRVYEVAAREEQAGCVHLVPAPGGSAQALSSTTREPTGSLPRVMSP